LFKVRPHIPLLPLPHSGCRPPPQI
jgi:hypothetical protein